MTDQQILAALGAVFLILQFLYRRWEKNDTQKLIDSMTTQIRTAVDSFDPHVERTKRTYGIVKDLKKLHEVRDEDGRPMWYMPREIIETQRELVALTHTVATTQKHMAAVLDRLTEKVSDHQVICTQQFNHLDKKGGNVCGD